MIQIINRAKMIKQNRIYLKAFGCSKGGSVVVQLGSSESKRKIVKTCHKLRADHVLLFLYNMKLDTHTIYAFKVRGQDTF